MIDLERALTELADHLDYPTTDGAAADLRRRLAHTGPGRRTRYSSRAAVLTVVAIGVVAIAPARHAVADWLGIGAVEIEHTERPLGTGPAPSNAVPGATGATGAANAPARLAAAREAVQFAIATPSRAAAGALAGVEVDRRVPGGLVALTYPKFTLVEIATEPTQPPPIGKLLVAGTPLENVTVNGQPGAWIAATHEIGYLDRRGNFVTETVRRSGPVLLWQRGGVTYRIEGLRTRDDALAVAATLP